MINNKTGLLVKTGERNYEFACAPDAPLGEVHDALCQMKKFIIDTITAHQKAEDDAKNAPKEEGKE